MKGDANVIRVLNRILTGELSAINQYFLHARMQKNWGYVKIADKVYKESIDEMRHADQLIERILYLDGLPNLQKLNPINIGETVHEQLKSDFEMEQVALKDLRDAIKVCWEATDYTSKILLENILRSEEEHVDWIEAQLSIINDIGVELYLAEQIHP